MRFDVGGMCSRVERVAWIAAGAAAVVAIVVYALPRLVGFVEKSRFEAASRSSQTAWAKPLDVASDDRVDAKAYAADTTEWSSSRIRHFRRSLVHSDAAPRGGILRSADGRIDALILEGTGEWSLNRGVGRIEGTAPLTAAVGNIGIAGHRDGFFRALRHVRMGDHFTIETPGRTRTFAVDLIRVVEPEAVHVLDPTATPTLTLVTCYPFYWVGSAPQRFIVRAREIDI